MADPKPPPVVTADVRVLPKSDPSHDARYAAQLAAIRRLLSR
jgi:hypothetical protein